ncbi:MAG: DUF2959 family protein [Planctomycetota bacterium]|nr:DUF2959 family protein [Planctomycetota bacterium]
MTGRARRRGVVMLARLVLGSLVLAGAGPYGCATSPPVAEPFVRDRTGAATRAMNTALHHQREAGDGLLETLESLRSVELEALTPAAAYDRARRGLLRADSRISSAEAAMRAADARAADLAEQWKAELRLYNDAALRESASARLGALRVALDEATASLRRSLATLAPVRRELTDRALYLKHSRDSGEFVPAPISDEGLAAYDAARENLRTTIAQSEAAVRHLAEVLRREGPPSTP